MQKDDLTDKEFMITILCNYFTILFYKMIVTGKLAKPLSKANSSINNRIKYRYSFRINCIIFGQVSYKFWTDFGTLKILNLSPRLKK